MPAIVAHHLFGAKVYAHLAPTIGTKEAEREAFLLGNLGPDPLFSLKVLPASVAYRDLGSTMHAEHTTKLLTELHEHFIARESAPTVCKAYALGFLCHYFLDSTVHPLVYAQQYAFCDAGIAGLTHEERGREVHAIIETELDEYLLTTRLGTSVDAFSPHRETLVCPDKALSAISATFVPVIERTYMMTIPRSTFRTSVRAYRLMQRALDSRREGLRRRIDYARLSHSHRLFIAVSTHSPVLRHSSTFANNDHYPWPHPFEEDATVSSSFNELYAAAFEKALAAIPDFAQRFFDIRRCAELSDPGNINFRGQKTSDERPSSDIRPRTQSA